VLRLSIALSVCGLLWLAALAAQQPTPTVPPSPAASQAGAASGKAPDDHTPRFVGQATEVIVPVTVTDEKGKFISNLERKDFQILDEGRPQSIKFFSHDQRQPIVVGFLVDMGNSMRIHWKNYQDAILELVWNLLPGDPRFRGYLITYSNEAELLVNTTQDSEPIADKVRKLKPGGGAALYDAIYAACTNRKLVNGEPYEPRRVLIIVGDGHNSVGDKSLEQVLEIAQRNLVTIYGMSTMAFGFDNEDQAVLERLATETGGRVMYPLNDPYKDVSGYLSNPQDAGNYAITVGTGGYTAAISKGIIDAVTGISGEITTQYILRYVPDVETDMKPKLFRKIKVEVPSLPTVKIHARLGYFPSPVPGSTPSGGQ
jgi:Ca-activated chloride channel family protein